MTHVHSHSVNHRFAWLTPLQGQSSSTGPWVLCENRTQHLENSGNPCASVTVNALLHLLAASFHGNGNDSQNTASNVEAHVSECGEFEVRKNRQDNCTSRLFVQQRTDYFQRLELYVGKQLVAAYHEPVWPHLQHPHPASESRLNVPVKCVEFLEKLTNVPSATYDMLTSANQAQRGESDSTEAA